MTASLELQGPVYGIWPHVSAITDGPALKKQLQHRTWPYSLSSLTSGQHSLFSLRNTVPSPYRSFAPRCHFILFQSSKKKKSHCKNRVIDPNRIRLRSRIEKFGSKPDPTVSLLPAQKSRTCHSFKSHIPSSIPLNLRKIQASLIALHNLSFPSLTP